MTAPAATPRTLPELRQHPGQLYVRNNTINQVHLHYEDAISGRTMSVELSPTGQMDSIATLPKGCLEKRGFQRMWMRGSLTVSADPVMEDEITLLMNQYVKAPEDRLREIMASGKPIDNDGKPVEPNVQINGSNVSKALVEKPCLQCGRVDTQSGVIVGGRVIQSAVDERAGIPPLCDEHVDQSHQFVGVQTPVPGGGVKWEFTRTQVNPQQKGIG